MRAWFPLAEKLAAQGLTVLAFDFRGYGQSEGDKDPAAYPMDVAGALSFLDARDNGPFAIVGAEGGGTAAVIAAADATNIKAVAILGAGAKFGPLDAAEAAEKLRLPALVYSSGGDGGDSLAKLITGSELRRTPTPLGLTDGGLQDALVSFLTAALK